MENSHRARFGSCNIDASPAAAMAPRIVSVPMLVFFGSDDSEVARIGGVMPREDLDFVLHRVIAAMG